MEFLGTIFDMGEAASVAIMGVVVLFFVISPIIGGLWARQIRDRATLIAAGAVFLLLADVLFTLVFLFGREVAGTAEVSDTELIVIAALIGLVIAWPAARTFAWAISGPNTYDPAGELRHLDDPNVNLMPQQRKRLERLQKRRR